ncbi:MAG: hypothetical protein JXR91_11845 [Deltaproteobacteria bacterium]|nr:hypothetical protein [Deltaproteobacteria bacterium]
MTLESVLFSTADFDAYASSKWSSNMYTLQRRAVKEKLDLIGKSIVKVLDENGLNLVSHLSDEFPSLWNKKKVDKQWLFFSRDVSARQELQNIIDIEKSLAQTLEDPTPLFRHIFIGVSVDEESIKAGIYLHYDAWVDRKNILALFSNQQKSQEFIELASKLPSDFEFGLIADNLVSTAGLEPGYVNEFARSFESAKDFMFLGKIFSKNEADAAGASFGSTIVEFIDKLLPVYKFIAWSPENDALSLDSIVSIKKHEIELKHQDLEEQRHQRQEMLKESVQKRQANQEAKKQEMLEEQDWREKERAKRRALAISKRAAAEAAWNSGASDKKINNDEKELHKSTADATPVVPVVNPEPVKKVSVENDKIGRDAKSDDKRSSYNKSASYNNSDRAQNNRRQPDGSRGSNGKRRERSFDNADKPSKKPVKQPNYSDERKADIQIGDAVIVTGGFLNNRQGVVQSIDEKGDLLVSFGMLSSRVRRGDVKGLGPSV